METISTTVVPEIESVKSKIRKLVNLTTRNGCSEGEALNAASMIGKLLTQYDLTLNQVLLDNQNCITLSINTGHNHAHPICYCTMAIAEYSQCITWMSTKYENYKSIKQYNFFGLETDCEMAKYLYELILQSINMETHKYKRSIEYKMANVHTHGKALVTSFQKGMVNRISQRLKEMSKVRINETTENRIHIVNPMTGSESSTDIVYVKQNKVQSEFEKLGLKLHRITRSTVTSNHSAFQAGRDAGNRINFNRPLGKSKDIAGLLE